MAIDKGTTLPITQLSGLQINYKDSNSCLNPPIVTTTERDALINTNDPDNLIKNGTIVFNNTTNYLEYYQATTKTWLPTGAGGDGNVVSPNPAKDGRLAVFKGDSGKIIIDGEIAASDVVTSTNNGTNLKIAIFDGDSKKIKAGGVTIEELQLINSEDKATNTTPLYQISNLGALQFGSNTNIADTGVILVDDLTPVTFQTQGTGVNAQVCTIFNGEEGAGSSSPSALVEINSSSGGFLNARMTTAQINALVTPVDGTIVYNTDTKTINSRQNGTWVSLGTGGEGGVTSVGITTTGNALTITGSPITSFGSIEIDLNSNLTGLTSIGTNTINLTANNNIIGLTAPSGLSGNLNFVFPNSNGSSGQILSTDGKGNTSWVNNGGGGAGGTVTSVGISNSDGNLTISGSPVTSSGIINIKLNSNVSCNNLSAASITNSLLTSKTVTILNNIAYTDQTGANELIVKAPNTFTPNTSFTFPNSNGSSGQVLSTNGSGTTSWVNNSADLTASYLLTQADSNLPNALVLPAVNTGTYSGQNDGSGNLYIGTSAGKFNPLTTYNNLAIGYQSLNSVANNSANNIAIGPKTLGQLITGYNNVAIGYQALANLLLPNGSTSNSDNTVLGTQAGSFSSSYGFCTFIGSGADATNANLILATAIGAGAKVGKSYAVVIGGGELGTGGGQYPICVGIGISSPIYSLHLGNTSNNGTGIANELACSILFTKTNSIPAAPTGQYDVCLWAQKGSDNGALFYQSKTGGIYKIDTTSQSSPAREAKIPVLTADEIKDLKEVALGALVYDTTNDRVLINTAKGWGSFGVNLI